MSDETIYHVEFDGTASPQYVLAPGEKEVHVVLKRMFRVPKYDFDWEQYTLTDMETTDIESMARGPDAPYSVLEAEKYHIKEHEKRVNQAGYKGIYIRIWNR